jgi:uncharacterized membrane protein required for colicin V production
MLDYIFIAIIILAVIFSAVRGFFRELELSVSFLCAVIVSYFLGAIIAPAIIAFTGLAILISIVIYVIIFFITLVLTQILANHLLDNFEIGDGINMLLGAVIGFFKGWIIIVILSLATFSISLEEVNFIKNSNIRSFVKDYKGLQVLLLNLFNYDFTKDMKSSDTNYEPSIVVPNVEDKKQSVDKQPEDNSNMLDTKAIEDNDSVKVEVDVNKPMQAEINEAKPAVSTPISNQTETLNAPSQNSKELGVQASQP